MSRHQAKILTAMLLATACSTGTGGVPPLSQQTAPQPVSAATALPAGPLTEAQLEFRMTPREVESAGFVEQRTLVVAREPRTGFTLWRTTARPDATRVFVDAHDGAPDTAAVVVAEDRLVRFYVSAPPMRIEVQESSQSFPSIGEAERAIVDALDAKAAATAFRIRNATVPLPELFTYLVPPGAPRPHHPLLTDARFDAGQWLVTLSGSSGKSAVVTLDSDYRVLDVRKDR